MCSTKYNKLHGLDDELKISSDILQSLDFKLVGLDNKLLVYLRNSIVKIINSKVHAMFR